MKLELNLSIVDAIHLQTVVLFEAKGHIKSYKIPGKRFTRIQNV